MNRKCYTAVICDVFPAFDRDILTASDSSLKCEENGNDQIVNW